MLLPSLFSQDTKATSDDSKENTTTTTTNPLLLICSDHSLIDSLTPSSTWDALLSEECKAFSTAAKGIYERHCNDQARELGKVYMYIYS